MEVYEIGYYKAFWYGVFNFVTNLFIYGALCGILALGAALVNSGDITIGAVTAFLFYLIQILLNFLVLSSVLGSVMAIVGASYKIVELLEYEPNIKSTGG